MEVKLLILNNEGESEVVIREEVDPAYLTFVFSDNPKQEYSIHMESLRSALKVFKNIKKIG